MVKNESWSTQTKRKIKNDNIYNMYNGTLICLSKNKTSSSKFYCKDPWEGSLHSLLTHMHPSVRHVSQCEVCSIMVQTFLHLTFLYHDHRQKLIGRLLGRCKDRHFHNIWSFTHFLCSLFIDAVYWQHDHLVFWNKQSVSPCHRYQV